jgi:hypothetical protein
MIEAAETRCGTVILVAHAGAAMPARVVERANAPILAAHEDNGPFTDRVEFEIAAVRNLALVAHEEPGAAEYALHLGREDVRVGIDPAMNPVTLRELVVALDRGHSPSPFRSLIPVLPEAVATACLGRELVEAPRILAHDLGLGCVRNVRAREEMLLLAQDSVGINVRKV